MSVSIRRSLSIALISGLCLSVALAGGASAGPKRTARRAYHYGTFADVDLRDASCSTGDLEDIGGAGLGDFPPDLSFPTRFGERHATITVHDGVPGQPIFGIASQHLHDSDVRRGFCTTVRVPIHGGLPLRVRLFRTMTDRGPSVVTDGTVTVGFSTT
jgi:hypothetical protein